MRKLIAALAAAGLLLTSACEHKTDAAPLTWEQPAPKLTFPAVPSGLNVVAYPGGRPQLRIYSPANGHLLRSFGLPQTSGRWAVSSDLGYAANQDGDLSTIHFSVRKGTSFRPVEDWDVAGLDLPGLPNPRLTAGGFLGGSDRYAVEVQVNDDDEIPQYKTFSFDPAQPLTTLNDEAGRLPPDPWFPHDYSTPATATHSFDLAAPPDHVAATTNGTAVIGAEIMDASGFLFTCGGGRFDGDKLACVGTGKQAEVGVLTADLKQETARFRLLGKLPGVRFAEVFAAPDGKHLLARRLDGFYALPAAGGTPKKVFGPLPDGLGLTVLSWSENH
jgi:hypothetical protein